MLNNNERPLRDLTIGDAKRLLAFGVVLILAVAFFVWMIGRIFIALLLGVVFAAYLLPVQLWLERRLRARAGSALVTIALIVVPLLLIAGYAWRELSGYTTLVQERKPEVINAISQTFEQYLAIAPESTRAGLEAAFAEGVVRSAEAIQGLKQQASLLLVSTTVFFFTLFYVLTQRVKLAAYIKLRLPGDFLPFYERLSANVGGALQGALKAVLIDQAVKGLAIFVLNLVFGVPLGLVLGLVTFLVGFFPLLGEWAVYLPISIYLVAFQHRPVSAAIYLGIGLCLTFGSSLFLRPRLASAGDHQQFNFYWMLLALVSGVYTFGISGIVMGPAILGFFKTVADTVFGEVRYVDSLLKSERQQRTIELQERGTDEVQPAVQHRE